MAPGWDVGEMPNVGMPYMEYPLYAPQQYSQRDQDNMRTLDPHAVKLEEQQREQRRSETGWASSTRGAYKPLGPPDLTLPESGSELRRIKYAAAEPSKPHLVMPGQRKRGQAAVREVGEIEQLELDQPIRASVRQFCYAYYVVTLRERCNLRISVKAISGDPDVFVSTDSLFPTIDDHLWRSGGKGDDVVLIETDHPRYVTGPLADYHIGVYAICDSEFELTATLAEVPLTNSMKKFDGALGNGYGTLTQLLSKAEERRRLCSFGRPALVKPVIKDTSTLYRHLPAHLKTKLQPAKPSAAPSAAPVAASPEPSPASPPPAASPRRQASFNLHSGESTSPNASPNASPDNSPDISPDHSAQGGEWPGSGARPAHTPLSVLLTPYLATAYFGAGLTPRMGGPKQAAAALPAATPSAQSAGAHGGSIDRRSSITITLTESPSAHAPRPPMHPWLPGASEPSMISELEEVASRASPDLRPLIMNLRHTALKEDMARQMERVACALEAERGFILDLKHTALENMLRATQEKISRGGEVSVAAEDTTDSLRAMRSDANRMCEALLNELREVAQFEHLREQQQARASPLKGECAPKSGRQRTCSNEVEPSSESPRGAIESPRRRSGQIGSPRRKTGRKSPSRASSMLSSPSPHVSDGTVDGTGTLPLLSLSSRAHLPGGAHGGASMGAAGAAVDSDASRLSSNYPVCLPLLQLSSPTRRVGATEPARSLGGLAMPMPPREAGRAHGAPAPAAVRPEAPGTTASPSSPSLPSLPSLADGRHGAMFVFEEVLPPPIEFSLNAPSPPDLSKSLATSPRSKRKAAPAPAPVLELPRPSDGDESDVAGSKLAVRTHVKKDKQLSRPFLISAAAAPPVRMTVPPPAAPPAVMVPSDS
jgi:hypothetical protein